MTLTLTSEQLKAIADQAKMTYPNECCGLMLGQANAQGRVVTQVWPARNAWDRQVATEMGSDTDLTTERRYWIAPEEMLAAMHHVRRQGIEVIGVYHSHPDHPAVPSECDRQLAWPAYVYIIVSLTAEKVGPIRAWVLDDQHQFQPEEIQKVDPETSPEGGTMRGDRPAALS